MRNPMTHTRETANDLIVIHKVALAEGLGGTAVHLIKLDGRDLPIPVSDTLSLGYELLVARESMPIPTVWVAMKSHTYKFYMTP
ncbi:dnaJ homolog subfamily B member 1 [Prunus yedoensis var. nudiflora]|uniref:DnaJ homolog subfamily B member 1 n=1 Tax=Prunus yedoensis var. nudiflora TaxID=2094558 RepID=A0A314UY03_PRUYE|nr:dnaJ homolog subfamily B member 1 [Prunus yedoensis var. nudiflora]